MSAVPDRPPLHVVPETGEYVCRDCARKEKEIEALEEQIEGLKRLVSIEAGKNTKLQKARHAEIGASPKAESARRVYAHWREKLHPRAAEKAPVDDLERILARLKSFSEADLMTAVDGAIKAAYVDEKGKRHDDIELIMRNSAKVRDFIGRAGERSAGQTEAPTKPAKIPGKVGAKPTTLFSQEIPAGPVDVRGLYGELGIKLPTTAARNLSVRCFASPDAHKREDRNASCSVSTETGAWRCWGCGAAGGAYDAAIATGQQPRYAMELLERYGFVDPKKKGSQREGMTAREQMVEQARRALAANTTALDRLHALRGWSPAAVLSLGLGMAGDRIVFPVRDAQGALVGVSRYAPNPAKRSGPKMRADTGSKRELFPAPETIDGEELWLVEGEPDAVAARTIELPATGLPGVQSWRTEWATRFTGRPVVICLDCDEEGRSCASRISSDLTEAKISHRIVDLAPSRTDGYDLGELVKAAERTPAGAREAAQTLRRLAEAVT